MINSIKFRIIFGFVVAVLLPLAIVATVMLPRLYDLQRQHLIDRQVQTAKLVAAEATNFVLSMSNQLDSAVQFLTLADVSDAAKSQLVQDLYTNQPAFTEVSLLDQYGSETMRIDEDGFAAPEDLKNLSDEDGFVLAWSEGEPQFGEPVLNLDTDKSYMQVVYPIFFREDGLFAGALVATVDFTVLSEMIQKTAPADLTNVYVTSPNYNVIAHIDPESRHLGRYVYLRPDNKDPIKVGLDQENVAVGVAPFFAGQREFQVGAEKLVSHSVTFPNSIILMMVVVAVALTGLAIWVGILLSSQIVSPINHVSEVAQSISVGEFASRVIRFDLKELAQLSTFFNIMASQIETNTQSLRAQTQELSQGLRVSMQISSRITNIPTLDALLEYVVDAVQTGFTFYHTHIYLIEPETSDLVMAYGYGDVGQRLKEQKHRLSAGDGIVGAVVETNQSFLSNNVDDLINFVRNPMLPRTRSELAVPLRTGNTVIGVLDVQSYHADRFSQEDQTVIQSLADQTAVAIENIRLLDESQMALQEVERLNRRLTGQVWEEFSSEVTTAGYRYIGGDEPVVKADSTAWIPPMDTATSESRLVQVSHPANGGESTAEMAIPLVLRGRVIGSIGVKRKNKDRWAEEEVTAVESVANQVTMALENARLTRQQEETIVELKEIDTLKSEFLTSMSHELRTPLNSIIGFADIMLQGIDGPLTDNALTDITAIHNSGKHLLALINNILDMSKIEAGRMELACSPLKIDRLFSDVASSVSSLLVDKPVELVQDVPESLPPLWADSLRLTQVIINLVSNAIKFTEEGAVTMGAELYTDKYMHIYVRDTGIGIPEDKLDLVFEHFRQVDSRNNRKYQGTGMGLAIARQLTELHGGEMWLESQMGEGSTFHFTIPLMQAADEAQ